MSVVLSGRVSIRHLKEVVLQKLPHDSTLREFVLREADDLDSYEVPLKVYLWSSLLNADLGREDE
ncbi:MAG: hypothetical protein ABSB53_04645 [Nitrososphaerales archaeon]